MRQSKRIAINTFSSWFGIFVNGLVLIFISKFLLNKLSEGQFGMLQYVITVQGAVIHLQLGLGATLNRFVSRLLATGEIARLNGIITFITLLFLGLGILAGLAMAGIGFLLPLLVSNCSEQLYAAGLLLMACMGGTLTVRFWGYAPQGILFGSERYDVVNIIHVCAALLRAGWIFLKFQMDKTSGLLDIGICFLGTAVIETILLWVFSKCHYPQMVLHPKLIGRSIVREVFGFSIFVLILGITTTLIASYPTFITGKLYGAEAVMFISLSIMVIGQIQRVSAGFAFSLIPVAGKYGALKDKKTLQEILLRGTRYCVIMCFPVGLLAVIFGHPLFGWFKEGLEWTWALLGIMMLPMLVRTTQRVAYSVLVGAGSVKGLAIGQVVVIIMIAVFTSLFAVQMNMGIYGVALGAALPILFFSMLFQPFYACRQIGLSWGRYMFKTYLIPSLSTIPTGILGVVLVMYFYPKSLVMIIFEAFLCMILFTATTWWLLTSSEKTQVIKFARSSILRFQRVNDTLLE